MSTTYVSVLHKTNVTKEVHNTSVHDCALDRNRIIIMTVRTDYVWVSDTTAIS